MQVKMRAATLGFLGTVALCWALPAFGQGPTITERASSFQFVDDESCAFPIDVSVAVARRTTTFSNGDVIRHATITATQTANGHSDVETDAFDVFIGASDPANWKITGRFGQIKVDGKVVYVQSGLTSYDPLTDTLSDPHPGPMAGIPDPCTALAS